MEYKDRSDVLKNLLQRLKSFLIKKQLQVFNVKIYYTNVHYQVL